MSIEAIKYYRAVKFGDRYPTRKLLMILLADRADEDYSCFPSIGLLADELETDKRAVRRLLDRLTADGYLSIEDRRRDSGASTSNRYHLHGPWDDWAGTGRPFAAVESKTSSPTRKAGPCRAGSPMSGEGGHETTPGGSRNQGEGGFETTPRGVTEPPLESSLNPQGESSSPGARETPPPAAPEAEAGESGERPSAEDEHAPADAVARAWADECVKVGAPQPVRAVTAVRRKAVKLLAEGEPLELLTGAARDMARVNSRFRDLARHLEHYVPAAGVARSVQGAFLLPLPGDGAGGVDGRSLPGPVAVLPLVTCEGCERAYRGEREGERCQACRAA